MNVLGHNLFGTNIFWKSLLSVRLVYLAVLHVWRSKSTLSFSKRTYFVYEEIGIKVLMNLHLFFYLINFFYLSWITVHVVTGCVCFKWLAMPMQWHNWRWRLFWWGFWLKVYCNLCFSILVIVMKTNAFTIVLCFSHLNIFFCSTCTF